MRVGRLDKRVEIRKRTDTQDARGFPAPAWATDVTRWAAVVPLEGTELFEAQRFAAKVSHRFEFRHDSKTGAIRPKDQLLYEARTFGVEAAVNVDEGDREVHVLATEGV